MTASAILTERNRQFAATFAGADLPVLPKLNTLIVACGDARVDPAHVLGLEPGDAVVIRNNGGRVTGAVTGEIAALAMMVAGMKQGADPSFDIILMQHTQCGAERLADPELQAKMRERLGIDVSDYAITDHREDLKRDLLRLKDTKAIPGYLTVSALLYDTATGVVTEIVSPVTLDVLRASEEDLLQEGQQGGS